MRFLLTVLLCLIISVSGKADYVLAVFGDSLSAGYRLSPKDSFYAQLEQALKEKGYAITVLNASKSGETAAGGRRKVNRFLDLNPDGVILELGVNDTFQNTPISTIQKDLSDLINAFQNRQIPVLLVGMKTFPNKPIAYQQQLEEMYQVLAAEHQIPLYPFFMDGVFNSDFFGNLNHQNDNLLPNDIHPSAKGVSIMVRGILPTVEHFLNQQGLWPQ